MSTIVTIQSSDLIANSRADINTNFSNLNTDKAELVSPAFTTPNIGVATATSVNKVTITSPATSATLTIANGASLITSGAFSLTLVATATSVLTLPAGTKTLVDTTVTALSSLATIGTITSGGLSTGAVIGGVTMTLGSDASYDTYYRNASAVLTRLANGTTGQVLTATTSGAPSWAETSGMKKISIVTTDVSLNTSSAETTLVSVSVPANTLGTANGIRVRMFIYNARSQNGTETLTLKLKYGATTLVTLGPLVIATSNHDGYFEAWLLATGATNSQEASFVGDLMVQADNSDRSVWYVDGVGTAAEDSTGALNLVITAQFSSNGANDRLVMAHAIIEKIAA